VSSNPSKASTSLVVAAIGIVFGDIGTSPLYAMKETFHGPHPLPLDALHVYGVLSLMFWLVLIVVTVKYVSIMMLADNRGEGGSLALLSLAQRVTRSGRFAGMVAVLGIFAAALFYGDSMLTPAISVLSAVEGLQVVSPELSHFIIPITIVILALLFMVQKIGTKAVGFLFGPVMCLWFVVLAALGIYNIVAYPQIMQALNPLYAVTFWLDNPWIAFLALGSVVLVLTGAEALYADMGHFGKQPIRFGWYALVLPALVINYMGQGALLLTTPEAVKNPFYLMAPSWALIPVIGLATAATVIASQAVISGAFSVTRQAIQLDLLPRMAILHTSAEESGQIYVPFVNWMLFILVCILILGFRSSSNLAAAYGVAVTATMLIDTALLLVVMVLLWRWSLWAVLVLGALFFTVDIALFTSNAIKIPHGGWFPLAVACVLFVMLTTWKRGRQALHERGDSDGLSITDFISGTTDVTRVPGTAVFMTASGNGVPTALLHNLKHNKVLHDRVVLLTVQTEDIPAVPVEQRVALAQLPHGFYRLTLHFGFMDNQNVPQAMELCASQGLTFNEMETSYFLNRETLLPAPRGHRSLPRWRAALFGWMLRNATTAMQFFNLPPNRVVELGRQLEL
jgi:KUP system potassium uptake protein